VHAALMYYHDNRAVIEQQNQRSLELVKQLKCRYPSKLSYPTNKDDRDDSVSS
jgi:hypothetical protein